MGSGLSSTGLPSRPGGFGLALVRPTGLGGGSFFLSTGLPNRTGKVWFSGLPNGFGGRVAFFKGLPNGTGKVWFSTGLPNGFGGRVVFLSTGLPVVRSTGLEGLRFFSSTGLPNGSGRVSDFFSVVRPTGLEGFRFFSVPRDAQPAEGLSNLRHLRQPLNVEQKCLKRVSDLSQQ